MRYAHVWKRVLGTKLRAWLVEFWATPRHDKHFSHSMPWYGRPYGGTFHTLSVRSHSGSGWLIR